MYYIRQMFLLLSITSILFLLFGLVHANDSVSITTAYPMYWELEDFECFSGKLWEGGFIKVNDESQQPIQAFGIENLF